MRVFQLLSMLIVFQVVKSAHILQGHCVKAANATVSSEIAQNGSQEPLITVAFFLLKS